MVSTFHSVCRAVAYAHAKGVLHRDLKPDNIMVGAFGEVYVLDWGLDRMFASVEPCQEGLRGGRTGALATQIGQVSGTPAYMPPEQARGDHHRVDARADVYALGATLYHLLAGRPPYPGPPSAALRQALAGPPPPVDRGRAGPIPRPLELIAACARAMERGPALRFPTAAALAHAVQAWLNGRARRALALEQVQASLRRAIRYRCLPDHRSTYLGLRLARALG
jgi:serine/threonine protein kinase